jgi:hypothetical protein
MAASPQAARRFFRRPQCFVEEVAATRRFPHFRGTESSLVFTLATNIRLETISLEHEPGARAGRPAEFTWRSQVPCRLGAGAPTRQEVLIRRREPPAPFVPGTCYPSPADNFH